MLNACEIKSWKELRFMIVILIVLSLVLYCIKVDTNDKCEKEGGEVVLVLGKLLKCKLPDGTFVKLNGD